ncbi:oocyte zinc finger protein XlCOF7.1-like isoform X1 [Pseudophryne corroboree]|uniref:oocyte zinc finger protein XlCOF7.1-like isoform X1 n=2 Tax=Pseudophryne corroboree TaxID=495146 RepID=UPI0030813762
MDDDRHMTERILNLTLEFICLLNGEDYTVVKKTSDEHVRASSSPGVSVGLSRTQISVMEPPPHSLINENRNDHKILELSNKIVHLLTGEVWQYLKRHKDLHMNMESRQPTTSLDFTECTTISGGSNTPIPSLDSVTEDHSIGVHIGTAKYPSADDQSMINSLQYVTEKPASCDGGNLTVNDTSTATDHTQHMATPIKEEAMSCDRGNLPHTDMSTPTGHTQYTSTDSKGGSVSCDEGDITHTDMYTPTDHTQYTATHIKEESNDGGNLSYIYTPTGQTPPISNDREEHLIQDQIYPLGDNQYSDHGTCFQQNPELVIHQIIHSKDKLHACSECGKCFSNNLALCSHQRSHMVEKRFSCSECGKCFTRNANLVKHKRIHTGVKPYSCPECGKSFIGNAELISHRRIHTGDKPFSCAECGKCFIRKHDFVIHERIHTGEKPYPCSSCWKRFVSSSDLVKHQKVHKPDKQYACYECGKCFGRSSEFIRHKREHKRQRFGCHSGMKEIIL